jgi:glc operon protein GlcG
MLDAALAHAEELDVRVSIVIVDNGGNLKALVRMDGASFLATTVATNKAITSAGLGMATQDFAQFAAGNPVLLTGLSSQPNVAILPGGVPIYIDGAVAGAIGVSGGQAGEDQPIAQAGLAALAPATVN